MNRSIVSLLLFLSGLSLTTYSLPLAYLLISLSFTVSAKEIYKLFVSFTLRGCPLQSLECLENACYGRMSNLYCGYIGFEVLDCRHGCYDLDEREFWARSMTLFNAAFTSGGQYFFVVQRGRVFLLAKRCVTRLCDLANNLLEAKETIGLGTELTGCTLRRLRADEVREILRPAWLKQVRSSPIRLLGVLILTAILTPYFPPFLVLLVLQVMIIPLIKGDIYSVSLSRETQVYSLRESTVTYTYPSLREVFSRARINYRLAQSIEYLAFRLEPASWEHSSKIDAKAYRSYEFGTALDKLSTIHQSQKYFLASRRRWERREPVYLASAILLATPHVREVYDRMGLHFSHDVFTLKVLE
ncbi:hypothetical protein [Infirmifilum sp. NZ]|uniref:hypothetical protein n=1 Tax=Infirmifilum sp. NZ TaxID=2926850 RepID=UPI0027A7714F|nr:hypothetical protein [Infirmifilum sp. NZ]UNQ72734.1 hypothetical protein MOV14_06355 [Infirmifilum sp. NZ]